MEINNVAIKRMDELTSLKEGDIVELTNGEQFEFARFKRTKFVGKKLDDGKFYDIPETMFAKIISKAAPKKINESYKQLKVDELFCFKGNKDETILAKFKGLSGNKIKAADPFTGMGWTIDLIFYRGKLSEIK